MFLVSTVPGTCTRSTCSTGRYRTRGVSTYIHNTYMTCGAAHTFMYFYRKVVSSSSIGILFDALFALAAQTCIWLYTWMHHFYDPFSIVHSNTHCDFSFSAPHTVLVTFVPRIIMNQFLNTMFCSSSFFTGIELAVAATSTEKVRLEAAPSRQE